MVSLARSRSPANPTKCSVVSCEDPRARMRRSGKPCARAFSLTMFVIADVRRGMCALYHYALLPITYLVTPYISYIILDTPQEKVRILPLALSLPPSLAPFALCATDETLGPLPCTSEVHPLSRARVCVYVHAFATARRTCARNTWRGLSNCIVNNLRKLRI